jgi:hypothetical protein
MQALMLHTVVAAWYVVHVGLGLLKVGMSFLQKETLLIQTAAGLHKHLTDLMKVL